jgi:transcriptional regulator with XRE-family HTH domain
MAGFSRSYYTEIETGKRNISILNLIKIMEALKVDPDEIIGFVKSKEH